MGYVRQEPGQGCAGSGPSIPVHLEPIVKRARHLTLVRPEDPDLARGDERSDVVREIATILASTTSFRGALPGVLDSLCEELGAGTAHAWVHAASPGGAGTDPAWTHLWHPDPPAARFDRLREVLFEIDGRPDGDDGPREADPRIVEPGRSSAAADALGIGDVARIDDVALRPGGEWEEGLREAGVRGVLALPVFAGERPVAVLELFFDPPLDEAEMPDDEALSLVRSELERRAAYDRMRDAVRRSARLWKTLSANRGAPETAGARNGAGSTLQLAPSGSEHDGLYDPVTSLPVRALLLDRVDHTLARRSRQPDRLFALVVFRVDGGSIERPGDDGGETGARTVVRALGRCLGDNVRPGDSVGHLSGSCLAVLLEDVSNRSDAAAVARRLEETVREEAFDLLDRTGARLRVGMALTRPAHEDAEDVADEALADAAKSRRS